MIQSLSLHVGCLKSDDFTYEGQTVRVLAFPRGFQVKRCDPQCAIKDEARSGSLIVCHTGVVVWGFSGRLDFSAMFHAGIVWAMRHSWDLMKLYEKNLRVKAVQYFLLMEIGSLAKC